MKKWLKGVRPPKFLRYFFYIAYSWYTPYASEKEDAHYTAAIFLAIPHMLLILILLNFFFSNELYEDSSRNKYMTVLPVFGFILVIHYFWFLYKDKWKKHVKEFDHLTKKERRRGTIYLFIYLSIYLFILLPMSIWVVTLNSPYYR